MSTSDLFEGKEHLADVDSTDGVTDLYHEMDMSAAEWEVVQQLQEADDQFMETCMKMHALFKKKNRQYGNAIGKTGVFGAAVELLAVTARLQQLVINSETFGEDEKTAVYNAFIDGANYSIIGLMMFEQDNWRGDKIALTELLGKLMKALQEVYNGSH